jgi:hypothetical protein
MMDSLELAMNPCACHSKAMHLGIHCECGSTQEEDCYGRGTVLTTAAYHLFPEDLGACPI